MTRRWSQEELDQLDHLTGNIPWKYVPRTYNKWASDNGYPLRTTTSLVRKQETKGFRRRVIGDWITTGTIAKTLGLSYSSPRYWIQQGWLPATRFGEGRAWSHYVKRSDLRQFARKHSHLLAGLDRGALAQLLESEDLADYLAELPPRHKGNTPVKCVETGRIYPSITKAARHGAYVVPQRLSRVLNTNRTANGYHWITV